MKVSKSQPLIRMLITKNIDFKIDERDVIIDDKAYSDLIKSLKTGGVTIKDPDELFFEPIVIPPTKAKPTPKPEVIPSKRIPHEMFKKLPEDEPKKFVRPAAKYTNPNWSEMYNDETD